MVMRAFFFFDTDFKFKFKKKKTFFFVVSNVVLIFIFSVFLRLVFSGFKHATEYLRGIRDKA